MEQYISGNLTYCPPGINVLDIWINHGFSKCFIETVSNGTVAIFLLIFGSIQLNIYRKYATPRPDSQLRASYLYELQLCLHLLVMLSPIARLIFQIYFDGEHVYGYMILSCVLTAASYLYAVVLMVKERNYMLPSVPTRGHGLILLLFWTLAFAFENLSFVNFGQKKWWFHLETLSDKFELVSFVCRYIASLLIFILGLKAPGIWDTTDYYGLNDSTTVPVNVNQGSTFRNAWTKIKRLAPFIWPKKDKWLQLNVLTCALILILGRVMNVYVPIYTGKLLDSMTTIPLAFRWDLVLIFVGLKFLQGGGIGVQGVLNNFRSFLWIRVQQYTSKEIEMEMFTHLHNLSLRWHLNRKSGEVIKVMSRGTDSINSLLSNILFSIAPVLVDILIAVIYFFSEFNIWFGIIIFVTMALYLAATILVTEWRTKFIRTMNLADNETNAKAVDSLLNYETVKFFGAERFECYQYSRAIDKYQEQEWNSSMSLNILNVIQSLIITGGLLGGSLFCVYLVTVKKTLTVGDYGLFSAYLLQLYAPLNWFGTYYRVLQKNFIDMENMLDLLKESQEVIDAPNARNLVLKGGQIEFKNVSFSYNPDRAILRNISFTVPAGKTVALVGASGSGKSTIVRLLFRFYDVDEGGILIDGQNLKTVTQDSVRKAIGIVPQEITLFNNTIKYNIGYGDVFHENDADIIAAAKSADLHDRITTFPSGYETQVGERGLRLSGGEKQRVGIARTVLKSPHIVLLDEATSALDTQTERHIQSALHRICADRTTIIVAHRLSTIIHADQILVMSEGEIVERGKHDDLIQVPNGIYAQAWNSQLNKNQFDDDDEPSAEQGDNQDSLKPKVPKNGNAS